MTELGIAYGKLASWRPWTALLEDRFTNVDIAMVLGALALTGLIGALAGAFLVY